MQARGSRQVHERFVDRDRLDQRRELEHERAHLAADARVFLHVGPDHAGVRAQPPRLEHGHRRSHAERARHVAGREHDAALASADDHRFVRERRIVALLDRGIEGVAVDMGDRKRVEFRMAQQARRAARRAAGYAVRRVAAAIAAEAGRGPARRLVVHRHPGWRAHGVSRSQ